MKYILKDKNGMRTMELRITNKTNRYIIGTLYKVYGGEPYRYSYHMDVNLRYEGQCRLKFNGINGDSAYYACGVVGMLNHMRVYAFLGMVAMMETVDTEGYVDTFYELESTGLLDGYDVEFLEEDLYVSNICKNCNYLVGVNCKRESKEDGKIGVCWYDEQY